MTELVGPTATLHESWLRARDEWPEGHQDGSGLRPDDEVETNVGFAAWVDRLTRQADRSTPVEPGHIGYSVRPTARGRGLATWALGAVLPRARRLGLGRVLLTCDEHNVASSRTIENNGGVLEDVRDTALGRKRRYWIELPA
jgi:RimJ/RimL family protein N-acetyltransferase